MPNLDLLRRSADDFAGEMRARGRAGMVENLRRILQGYYRVEVIRGPESLALGLRDEVGVCKNIVVDEGINYFLDHLFDETTADKAPWNVGLLGSGTPAAGWTATDIGTNDALGYTESVLQAYVEGAAASKIIHNTASKAVFSMNATDSITGLFVIELNTKATPAGTLLSAGNLGTALSVNNLDTVNAEIIYTGSDQ